MMALIFMRLAIIQTMIVQIQDMNATIFILDLHSNPGQRDSGAIDGSRVGVRR